MMSSPGQGARTALGWVLVGFVVASLVGCTSALPTGRFVYVSEMTNAEVPSVRGFFPAEDQPGCEAAVATARSQAQSPLQRKLEFGRCRMAVLEPGADYWVVWTNIMSGNPVAIGSSVQRFCEATAKQHVSAWARCSPTSIRFMDAGR